MDFPQQLLSYRTNEEKWIITESAVQTLESIKVPIVPIAIVGDYRSGKSLLMNQLAGKTKGFQQSSANQKQTKGIWMLPIEHPQNPDTCLLLLDTEGLNDQDEEKEIDIQIFILTLLLSSCLILNTFSPIDEVLNRELSQLKELIDLINLQGKQEDESGCNQFPKLVILLRDNILLTGEQKIAPAEYLNYALESRKGLNKKTVRYKSTRGYIKRFFPELYLFALPRPFADIKNDSSLEPESVSLKKLFKDETDRAKQAILSFAEPMNLDGNNITGKGFAELCINYVDAINEGEVPNLQLALEKWSKRVDETASQIYPQQAREREYIQKDISEREKFPSILQKVWMVYTPLAELALPVLDAYIANQTYAEIDRGMTKLCDFVTIAATSTVKAHDSGSSNIDLSLLRKDLCNMRDWPAGFQGLEMNSTKVVIDILKGHVQETQLYLQSKAISLEDIEFREIDDEIEYSVAKDNHIIEAYDHEFSRVQGNTNIGDIFDFRALARINRDLVVGKIGGILFSYSPSANNQRQTFMMTARHNLTLPTGLQQDFTDLDQGRAGNYCCQNEQRFHRCSRLCKGIFGSYGEARMGVDIVILPLSIPTQVAMEADVAPTIPSVYRGNIRELMGVEVERNDIGHATYKGKVVYTDYSVKIGGGPVTECVGIVSIKEGYPRFSESGDSGSLVVRRKANGEVDIIGLISKGGGKQWNGHDCSWVPLLRNGLEAMRSEFEEELSFDGQWRQCQANFV